MKHLLRVGAFPQVSALLSTKDFFLAKKKDMILLLDKESWTLQHLDYPKNVNSFLMRKDEALFYPLSGLFEGKCQAYSFPDFQRKKAFDISLPEGEIIRNGIALPDCSFMFLCEKKEESYLLHVRKDGEVKKFLEGEGLRIDDIFFAESINALLLFSKTGCLSYFAEGKILRKIEIPKMDKVRPLGKGNVLLGNAPQGFYLLSGNGRVLRKLEFLLPKPDREREGFRDFVLDWRKELCLYWTSAKEGDAFYLFSTKDFSLLDYLLERKKETTRIAYDGNGIYLRQKDRIVCYRFVD